MFSFRKRLLYPVHVEKRDPLFAQVMMEHYGGRDSEFSAAAQYLNHRLNMPNKYVRELLGMIAAEELSHMEMIGLAVSKLGCSVNYVNAQGAPWSKDYLDQCIDPIMMLGADIETEARSRELYQEHIKIADDPGIKRMLNFLAGREEVHQRLFEKAQKMIIKNAPQDPFAHLIYEYKMSLQVLE